MAVATPILLTTDEAARVLRVSAETVRRRIAAGELPAARIGGRGPWLIDEDALAELLRPASSSASDTRAAAPAASGSLAELGADHDDRPSTGARADRVAPVADLRPARALPQHDDEEDS